MIDDIIQKQVEKYGENKEKIMSAFEKRFHTSVFAISLKDFYLLQAWLSFSLDEGEAHLKASMKKVAESQNNIEDINKMSAFISNLKTDGLAVEDVIELIHFQLQRMYRSKTGHMPNSLTEGENV